MSYKNDPLIEAALDDLIAHHCLVSNFLFLCYPIHYIQLNPSNSFYSWLYIEICCFIVLSCFQLWPTSQLSDLLSFHFIFLSLSGNSFYFDSLTFVQGSTLSFTCLFIQGAPCHLQTTYTMVLHIIYLLSVIPSAKWISKIFAK